MIALPPPSPATALATPTCRTGALRLKLDAGDGEFTGMSHSGVLVIVRNRSGAACSVAGLPRIEALDARGRALPVVRQVPPSMHPGPMIPPVLVAPRAALSTPLRWVTGEVFDKSRCFTPATMRLTAGPVVLRAPWASGQICGEAGKPATFEQPVLRPGTEMSAP